MISEDDLKLVENRKPGRPRKAQDEGAAKTMVKKRGK
jgi:hypothetical protein